MAVLVKPDCSRVQKVNVILMFLCLQRPPPVLDALGRVISEAPPDQWEARYSA